ncbi:uncharacterized protein PV07_08800 [Cladophialophora immunda]|uniref:Uncharacterized protein n=1 Tax=Cladophialophora immunda TaxID=569365 RepID=A0A0D2CPX3_9EURO|nr:uncharacterized protein PV07_08800 [Cladophialophora immunda]KIW25634.1 hypothetical protein PV07_08800 [Cladophialophora immunda]
MPIADRDEGMAINTNINRSSTVTAEVNQSTDEQTTTTFYKGSEGAWERHEEAAQIIRAQFLDGSTHGDRHETDPHMPGKVKRRTQHKFRKTVRASVYLEPVIKHAPDEQRDLMPPMLGHETQWNLHHPSNFQQKAAVQEPLTAEQAARASSKIWVQAALRGIIGKKISRRDNAYYTKGQYLFDAVVLLELDKHGKDPEAGAFHRYIYRRDTEDARAVVRFGSRLLSSMSMAHSS